VSRRKGGATGSGYRDNSERTKRKYAGIQGLEDEEEIFIGKRVSQKKRRGMPWGVGKEDKRERRVAGLHKNGGAGSISGPQLK